MGQGILTGYHVLVVLVVWVVHCTNLGGYSSSMQQTWCDANLFLSCLWFQLPHILEWRSQQDKGVESDWACFSDRVSRNDFSKWATSQQRPEQSDGVNRGTLREGNSRQREQHVWSPWGLVLRGEKGEVHLANISHLPETLSGDLATLKITVFPKIHMCWPSLLLGAANPPTRPQSVEHCVYSYWTSRPLSSQVLAWIHTSHCLLECFSSGIVFVSLIGKRIGIVEKMPRLWLLGWLHFLLTLHSVWSCSHFTGCVLLPWVSDSGDCHSYVALPTPQSSVA